MSGDIEELLKLYKEQLDLDKLRLSSKNSTTPSLTPHTEEHHFQVQEKDNLSLNQSRESAESETVSVNKLQECRFAGENGNLDERKMLRYGEFSPNNPQFRVNAAPYLGIGEYDQRRDLRKRSNAYTQLNHQTRYDYDSIQNLSPYNHLKSNMDKPKSILSNRRTGSPRERLVSKNSYTTSFMDGFSYQDKAEQIERERIKKENYQRELKLQIEEKRAMQARREEQNRREQELENRRLEQQLLRLQEETNRNSDQVRRHSEDLIRRKQDMQYRYRKHTESESGVGNLRNSAVSSKVSHYSPPVSRRNFYSLTSTPSGECYSYFRKDALNRMDYLNSHDHYPTRRYNNDVRYDSLGRLDALDQGFETLSLHDNVGLGYEQRRHSATQQDLSATLRRSPKLQRRSSSGRFEDGLPMPLLKAHSPVAKELKNSVPLYSGRSEVLRRLEDKWQIPAVQKNFLNYADGQSRSILTQLGAIRMQLQQEQMRMDETLRKRDLTQSKAVDFH